jgi:hypothetical protein
VGINVQQSSPILSLPVIGTNFHFHCLPVALLQVGHLSTTSLRLLLLTIVTQRPLRLFSMSETIYSYKAKRETLAESRGVSRGREGVGLTAGLRAGGPATGAGEIMGGAQIPMAFGPKYPVHFRLIPPGVCASFCASSSWR